MRRGAVAVGLGLVLLVGCSPADVVGVTRTADGRPVITDCGTYIVGVDARDADDGREIWSARKSNNSINEVGGDFEVEVGRLPNGDWTETDPLALEPRPTTWLFVVVTDAGGTRRLRLDDDELVPGRVARPGHDTVSLDEFENEVCYGLGIDWRWFAGAGLGAVAFTALAIYRPLYRRRLRRERQWT